MRTIIEPFRIKMTESIKLLSPEERSKALAAAHYNVFLLEAEDWPIDLSVDRTHSVKPSKTQQRMDEKNEYGSYSAKKFSIQQFGSITKYFLKE